MSTRTELLRQIEDALDVVRPHLKVDGGDVEVIDFEDGVLKIRWLGNCLGCSMSQMTLKGGIETTVCSKVHEVKSVIVEE